LFQQSGASIEEKAALDDAIYGLHALRSTSQRGCCLPRPRILHHFPLYSHACLLQRRTPRQN
jgi:hypothetical protein